MGGGYGAQGLGGLAGVAQPSGMGEEGWGRGYPVVKTGCWLFRPGCGGNTGLCPAGDRLGRGGAVWAGGGGEAGCGRCLALGLVCVGEVPGARESREGAAVSL